MEFTTKVLELSVPSGNDLHDYKYLRHLDKEESTSVNNFLRIMLLTHPESRKILGISEELYKLFIELNDSHTKQLNFSPSLLIQRFDDEYDPIVCLYTRSGYWTIGAARDSYPFMDEDGDECDGYFQDTIEEFLMRIETLV
jgi:hypothetical protein